MGIKPIFLSITSAGWDGSSPFGYTLQRIAKYSHFGYAKRSLSITDPEIYTRIFNNTWENYSYNRGHKMNHKEDLEPLKDFPLRHLEDLLKCNTDEQYVEYCLALYHHVKSKGYKAVSDFCFFQRIKLSNSTSNLHTLLNKSFEVKSIILFRDPVRSAISRCMGIHKTIRLNLDEFFFDYITSLDRLSQYFTNTIPVIMEELWEGNGKESLSSFLDHPIDELWPNLYSPDIGHYLEWDLDNEYCPTPCQPPGQSRFIVTPRYYNELRSKYSFVYDNWIKRFGSLPLHWGEPLDYDKNLEVYPHYSYKKPLEL